MEAASSSLAVAAHRPAASTHWVHTGSSWVLPAEALQVCWVGQGLSPPWVVLDAGQEVAAVPPAEVSS